MIKSFKHKGLELFYTMGSTKGIQANHKDRLQVILARLDAIKQVSDINLPSFRLHKSKGDKNELWSITVQANWRITFRFENENVYVVDYLDYH